MKNLKLFSFLLTLIFILPPVYGQDINKTIVDAKTEELILTGYTTREAFKDTSFSWWFNSEYEIYSPDSAAVPLLKEKLKNIDITIVMGTWCSDSRREVPRFFKIMDAAGFPADKITIINVDQDKTAELKKEGSSTPEEFKVKLVPVFIFYINGEEKGKITEMPEETLEKDMLKIMGI
jgi:thiol-disulfide isomerase/thioredoxin